MSILETERTRLRELHEGDAAFTLELLNEPGWLRFIGDRGIRTEDAAREYIEKGPVAMYGKHGFGLWAVERKSDGATLGMCGLIKRDTLDDVDIGFAFLERHSGQGYAFEAANAVMAHALQTLKLPRVVAITSVDNDKSIRLLGKVGLKFEKLIRLAGSDEDVRLFGTE
ncbi:GNAT family N-acetyltransferase [Piscinibacter terrae]|uniref:N-acetyltransferase n=1 Tax=Piscinibacter terrae TaxID=2496871 RepID=A0A3N7HXR3_9BURK|nr:GNAT family N-acetyltransferase [Albitalea terrae]RQP25851.1 N-acetyltransferase [Albitalea terrae]